MLIKKIHGISERLESLLLTKTEKRRRAVIAVTMLSVFFFMLYLNIRCPALSDDYHFIYVWKWFDPTGTEHRISTFGDLLESSKNYYMYSGGRVLCHFMLFAVLMLPTLVFDIINSAVYVYFGYCILKTAEVIYEQVYHTRKLPVLSYPLTYLAMVYILPQFGDCVLWTAGALNYLWSTVLLLNAVRTIDMFFKAPSARTAAAAVIPLTLSALTNETTGGMLFVYVFIMLFHRAADHKLNKKMLLLIIPMCFVVMGIAVVVLSPGNSSRAEQISHIKIKFADLHGLLIYPAWLLSTYTYLFYIVLLDIILRFIGKRKKLTLKRIADVIYFYRYTITGIAGIIALGFAQRLYERAAFPGVALIIVGFIGTAASLYRYLSRCDIRKFLYRFIVMLQILFVIIGIRRVLSTWGGLMILGTAFIYLSAEFLLYLLRGFLFPDKTKFTIKLSEKDTALIASFREKTFSLASYIVTVPMILMTAAVCLFTVKTAYSAVLYEHNISVTIDTLAAAVEGMINNEGEWYDIKYDLGKLSKMYPQDAFLYTINYNYTLKWIAYDHGIKIDIYYDSNTLKKVLASYERIQ